MDTELEHSYDLGANAFWSLYVSEAEQHDKNTTETWKADMDSTLIFAGLFSAMVTSFIIESYKLLKVDNGDVTNALLVQILLAQTGNASSISVPAILANTSDFGFVPCANAIVVNILWFLSLACSLTAALCITLTQQWIRNYVKKINGQNQPLRRARVRSFLYKGMEKWKMDKVVENIPTFLHASRIIQHSGTLFPRLPYYSFWCQPPSGDFNTVAHANLTAAREQLALNPRHSRQSEGSLAIENDAKALLWVYSKLNDHRKFLSFVRSIPEFLDSREGHRTWTTAFMNSRGHQFSAHALMRYWYPADTAAWASLEFRICTLLFPPYPNITCEDPPTRRQRTTACVDGLFAIIRYQLQSMYWDHGPQALLPPAPNLRLSAYVAKSAISREDDPSISTAICVQVLHQYRFIQSSTFRGHTIDIMASKRADQALRDVAAMRQILESVLDQVVSHDSEDANQPHGAIDLKVLLQVYLGTLRSKSRDLLIWMRAMETAVDSFIEYELVLWWLQRLPREGAQHRISLRHIPPFNDVDDDLTLALYAIQLLASMRGSKAGSSISYCFPSSPLPRYLTSHAWLPFLQLHFPITGRKARQYFSREVQPIALLLDLVVGDPEKCGLETREGTHSEQFLPVRIPNLIKSTITPRCHWNLPDWINVTPHGPCSILAFVLDDIHHGGRVYSCISLISDLKTFTPKVVNTDIIDFTLNTLGLDWSASHFDDTRSFDESIRWTTSADAKMSEGSQVLFVYLLHKIIETERKASLNNPCPFRDNTIAWLLRFMELSISSDSSLQAAEHLFGLSHLSEPAGEMVISTKLRDKEEFSRLKLVCEHIRAQRSSKSKRRDKN
ncbi:hypothetical protein H0H87_010322 [Tephrocybe sp. NHM501043]|nr:hypothetical protein H0H87_010322 [Tephrocybe sp. NHM501043]